MAARSGTAPRTAGLMVLGNVVIYALGATWLAAAIGVSLSEAISLGVTPFLLGDALKVALAAGLFPLAWLAMNNESWGVPLILLAYTPLCIMCWKLK